MSCNSSLYDDDSFHGGATHRSGKSKIPSSSLLGDVEYNATDDGNLHAKCSANSNASPRATAKSKNIIMCFDGTSCEFGPKPFTNVLRFYRLLEKDDESQLCYYQPGIGTIPRASNNVIATVNESCDALAAFSMKSHILEAYTFLTRFYREGDKIFLIGFSRGAFTARAVSGMISKVGLLKRGNENLIDLAYECYISWEYNVRVETAGVQNTLVNEFKRTFSRENITIHFMGLWDSVNSVGIIRDRMFPYTSRTKYVQHVRHAVSIDERRGKFKQCLFHPYAYCPKLFNIVKSPYETVGDDRSDNVTPQGGSEPASLFSTTPLLDQGETSTPQESAASDRNNAHSVERSSLVTLPLYGPSPGSAAPVFVDQKQLFFDFKNSDDLIEKWFCGDHCDVGGRWAPDNLGYRLSNIPLKWIVGEAYRFGVKFKRSELIRLSEESDSFEDSLSCKHDSLAFPQYTWYERISNLFMKWFRALNIARAETESSDGNTKEPHGLFFSQRNNCNTDPFYLTILWWLCEIFPLGTNIEDKNGKWRTYYLPNLGRPRKIPENADFHWSVYWRLKWDTSYRPKNLPFDVDEVLDPTNNSADRHSEEIAKFKSADWNQCPDDLDFLNY